MATHTLDVAKFRQMFPAFGDPALWPDALLEMWFDFATCEISPRDNCVLHGKCLDNALMLCLAHILTLMSRAAAGQTATGAITSASIDKVAVGFTAPPYVDGWGYWLGLTPYGLQLQSLLSVKAAGGFYIGGLPEADAFRKIGGLY